MTSRETKIPSQLLIDVISKAKVSGKEPIAIVSNLGKLLG